MRRVTVLGALIVVGGLSIGLGSQQLNPAAVEATKIEVVKGNLYVIGGGGPGTDEFSGGNSGVFVGSDGVTLVDTKLGGWGQLLLDRIATVTDKPVIRIINTHTHGDHVGSNSFFPASVEIIVHENTRTNMQGMEIFEGDNSYGLPDQAYTDTLTIGSGSDQIDLYYFGAGHTNGDTFVVYPALRVLQTGDMFPWRDAPFLDRNNGGSGLALPDTLERLINTVTDIDTVVPGHIPVTTPGDLRQFQRFTYDLREAVRNARDTGKSVEQAVASIDLTAQYHGYNTNRMAAAIGVIYDELGQ
ncbi:MAG TPA: MBL fold metallo-hydrolase [Acidobacteria bacterium]|nr:MBL fold metallo-hydrolase [Acidobacteriota bacterium]